jgi:hypothetical protein
MRRIPPPDIKRGLNAEAAQAVQMCDSSLAFHYDLRFHRSESAQESVACLKNRIVEAQHTMANLDKHVTYVKKSFCGTVDGFLSVGHKKLESLRQTAMAMIQDIEPDPALRFLRAIQMEFEVNRLNDEIDSLSQETERFLQHARAVGYHCSRNSHCFPPPSPTMFNIITCPQDSTKLRLPENSGDVIATCPTCRYRFAYSTTPISFLEPPTSRKATWMERMRNALKTKGSNQPERRV